jgi:hypothetical protein
LFYAATSKTGGKFLSMLLIALSAIIILAAVGVIFRKKITEFVKNNPFIKFFYHALFVIPCLFIDLVNYIYYEFKSSPKIVFVVFAVEVAIILSLILFPILRKKAYIYITNEKGKKQKIRLQIVSLESQKEKLKKGIKRIKTFRPAVDPLVFMTLNSLNDLSVKNMKKNVDTGKYEEALTPENTQVFKIVYKYLNEKKDFIKKYMKKVNPVDSIMGDIAVRGSGTSIDNNAWKRIKKFNLDKKENQKELKELLYSYGYKRPTECDRIMNKKQSDKCKELLDIMMQHIQMNAKNILLFSSSIKEIDDQIVRLKDLKKKSKNILQKGSIALDKPVYFRKQRFITIKDFNKNQVENMRHNYSLSCWFFVHSQSPNYSPEYNRETEILSYNGEPTIYYSGKTNELVIRSKKISENASEDSSASENLAKIKKLELEIEEIKKEIIKEKKKQELNAVPNVKVDKSNDIMNLEDMMREKEFQILHTKKNMEDGKNDMVLIYKKSKFKLQKWHNLVVNYVGGTIDIFLNGKLVGSTKRIISYKMFNQLTIGDRAVVGGQGIGGGICNVVYYPTYISRSRIESNYSYFKDKNPPTI